MTTGLGGPSGPGAPYARQASQGPSSWYMGCLFSVLAGSDETDGRFGPIEMVAQKYMHKHYAERAEHRAFHARYATGDGVVRYAGAFQRAMPQVVRSL
jgi:hypothetical protein